MAGGSTPASTLPSGVTEYVLLPSRGVSARGPEEAQLFRQLDAAIVQGPGKAATLLWPPSRAPGAPPDVHFGPIPMPPAAEAVPLRVLDSVHETGPKLVEVNDEAALRLRGARDVMRLLPNLEYRAMVTAGLPLTQPPGAAAAPPITVQVRGLSAGVAIDDAEVTALTNAALGYGDRGVTDHMGHVKLQLGPGPVLVQELYIEPTGAGHWGAFRQAVQLGTPHVVDLEPVDLSFAVVRDVLRHFYGSGAPGGDGTAERVAVIDTGVDLHHPDSMKTSALRRLL